MPERGRFVHGDDAGPTAVAAPVRVALFGPVTLRVDGREVPVGGAKRKSALALLALAGGSGVPVGSLLTSLFGQDFDERAVNTLQVHLSQLRGLLAPYQGALARVGVRYRLDPTIVTTDVAALDRALTRWRTSGVEALADLRGATPPLPGELCADVPDLDALTAARVRYGELRLDALEVLFDAELQAGAGADLPERIEAALEVAPLRERLWAQLMLALYAGGRQGAALDAYRRARRTLADEVGIDPGPALRELEVLILRQSHTMERAVPALAATGTCTLVWLDASGAPQSVPLLPGREVTIGRGLECTIRLNWDPAVSRRHAAVALTDGRCLVRDLGSRNGTFVGDEPVTGQKELPPRGTIRAGGSVLFLRDPADRVDSRATTRTG